MSAYPRTYGGADAFCRLQRMRGREVFQPIGFDASGHSHRELRAEARGAAQDADTAHGRHVPPSAAEHGRRKLEGERSERCGTATSPTACSTS